MRSLVSHLCVFCLCVSSGGGSSLQRENQGQLKAAAPRTMSSDIDSQLPQASTRATGFDSGWIRELEGMRTLATRVDACADRGNNRSKNLHLEQHRMHFATRETGDDSIPQSVERRWRVRESRNHGGYLDVCESVGFPELSGRIRRLP